MLRELTFDIKGILKPETQIIRSQRGYFYAFFIIRLKVAKWYFFSSLNDQANIFSREILEPNRVVSLSFTSILNIQSFLSPHLLWHGSKDWGPGG